ncbi:unnamed protein product [Bathycoccus prasinos]
MFFGGLNDPSEKLRKEQKKELEKRSKVTAARRLREGEQQRETNRNTNAETKTKSKKKEKRYEVLWKAELRVRVENVALKRGIRTRREDKIQLPGSALRMLERFDDGDETGARQPNAFFYVSRVVEDEDKDLGCYCAALDYQAEEDSVVIPTELYKRLGYSSNEKNLLRVEFRTRALEKCEWVKLQPKSNDFSKFLTRHPEADVKIVLEHILVQRSCVHVGDVFEVDFSGFVSSSSSPSESSKFVFELKVVSLKVEGGEEDIVASLIETDVEVDLAPSMEHDEVVERIDTLNRNDEEEKRKEKEKKLAEAREARRRIERNEERKEKLRRFREAMAKKLPLEPPPPLVSSSSTLKTATTNNVVRIRISLPTGEAIDRRFYDTDDVSSLFDFVLASYSFEEEEDKEDSDFCLVTRGGRFGEEKKKRIYKSSRNRSSSSLGAAGVASGDVFFVEKM